MRILLFIPPIVFAGLAGLFVAGMQRDNPGALPSVRTGGPAPALTLETLGDKPGFARDLLEQDGVKLVNIWASWCAPCRVEHPQLVALAEEGVPVYGINYKDDPVNALSFLDDLGDPYMGVGADPEGRTALDWGVYGVPETFIVDGDGVIIGRIAGPVTQAILADQIRPALAN